MKEKSDENVSNGLALYLREVKKYPRLSNEEERELGNRVILGDMEARDKFIKSNLRLVIKVAIRYQDRGVSLMELIQEGNEGLIRAVDKYDPSKECNFATYAIYWIKQSIIRSIPFKGRNITLSNYVNEKILAYKEASNSLAIKLGREPVLEEIANEMNISYSEALKLYQLQYDTVSTNASINEDIEETFEEFVADDVLLDDIIINKILSIEIDKLFDKCKLTENQKRVLILRNGLDGLGVRTLDEAGTIMNLSRQGVRQIEILALKKIRKNPYVNRFAIYMDYPEKAIENINEYRKEIRYRQLSKIKEY